MPRNYLIKSLSSQNAALAYPLIQTARPEISLDVWIAYIAKISQQAAESGGIIIVESKRGYIHGLFIYAVAASLGHGTVLNVQNFVALDTGDRAAAVKLLIGVMEDLAREFGCEAIHTDLPDAWISRPARTDTVLAHLRDAGHQREIVKLCKMVPVA